jgi:hypothetical protein
MKTPLLLRYFLWSMLIFALSMFFLSFGVLDSLRNGVIALGANLHYSLNRYGPYSREFQETTFPYRILPVYGPQISQEQYFRIAREAAHRLKIAGAKVVIVPMPDSFTPSPQIDKALEEMVADSIVVFGAQGSFNSYLPWERDARIENKDAWWVKHPFFNARKVPWGVMSPALKENNPLIRFVPVGFRETDTGVPVPDVATLALKRYCGIPDDQELPVSRSRLVVGSLGMQLAQDGICYLRFGHNLKRQSEIWMSINPSSDSLEYLVTKDSKQSALTTEQAWANHKGAIVFMDWGGAQRYQYVYYGWVYLQIFGSAFNGTFLTVHNEWNVLLITTLVVLLSVFSYTFRNGLMVFVSLVLIVAAFIISGWLFTSYNILFDPTYALVTLALCGFVLPIVKTSGEKRIAEEKLKSLEEENRRLLDLQRSAAPRITP